MSTAAAAADLSTVALVDGFLGNEADTWTDRIQVDTAALLGHLATARDIVGGALVRYADVLEQCQHELRRLDLDRQEQDAQEAAQVENRRLTGAAGVKGGLMGVEVGLMGGPPPGRLLIAARASAARHRHDDAQRSCVAEIGRSIALAPGSIPGVRPGVAAPSAVVGIVARRPSNIAVAGAGLIVAARMSTQVPPALTAAAPAEDDGEFLDPQTKAIYREKFYQRCLAEQKARGNFAPSDGILVEAGCGVWADSVVSTRENLLHAALAKPGTIDPLPELPPSGLLGASNLFMTFLFAGCMEGSTGGCLFDVASMVVPFGKLGKIGKDVAEALKHADDAVDTAKGARAARHADDAAAARKADEPAGPERPADPEKPAGPEKPEEPPGKSPDSENPSASPGSGPFGGFTRDELLAAGRVPDRNGFTQAGRQLQKHGGREVQKNREGKPSVFYGMSSGTASQRNEQGQRVLTEILDDVRRTDDLDRVVDIYDSTGRGVRFKKATGELMGFLEP